MTERTAARMKVLLARRVSEEIQGDVIISEQPLRTKCPDPGVSALYDSIEQTRVWSAMMQNPERPATSLEVGQEITIWNGKGHMPSFAPVIADFLAGVAAMRPDLFPLRAR